MAKNHWLSTFWSMYNMSDRYILGTFCPFAAFYNYLLLALNQNWLMLWKINIPMEFRIHIYMGLAYIYPRIWGLDFNLYKKYFWKQVKHGYRFWFFQLWLPYMYWGSIFPSIFCDFIHNLSVLPRYESRVLSTNRWKVPGTLQT